ncbi:hypothetical protein EYC80_009164 [Monilinia laxa]|uniref:Uncharacterized protein n=1 Tax=Monilinia laxa TaxID=61186 RepID=A0A5N6K2P8_MONLA|nr:hypothetical protein EYC80_009164 [Monilinia laxa]
MQRYGMVWYGTCTRTRTHTLIQLELEFGCDFSLTGIFIPVLEGLLVVVVVAAAAAAAPVVLSSPNSA